MSKFSNPLPELVATPEKHLKCCLCLDGAIANWTSVDTADIPDAVTLAPVFQTFSVAGQQVGGVVPVPVCLDHRRQQLGVASKTGLVTV